MWRTFSPNIWLMLLPPQKTEAYYRHDEEETEGGSINLKGGRVKRYCGRVGRLMVSKEEGWIDIINALLH